MGDNVGLLPVVLPLLMIASAFFSGAETAVFSLNFIKIRHLQARAGKRGRLLAKMVVRPKQLISTILIGNDLINITASAMVGAYMMEVLGPKGRWYAFVLMAFLILVFGEILPKTLAVKYPVGISLFAAPIMYRLYWLVSVPNRVIQLLVGGIVRIMGGEKEADLITEDEFKVLVREGRKSGVLDRDEEDIIYNILELGDTAAADLMVPRTEIFAVEEKTPLARVLELHHSKTYSRIPVYSKDIDNITGILYIKDILLAISKKQLSPTATAGGAARKPFIVPETMRTDMLFVELRNRRVHLAVVVDEYGGTAGIVTMEDLLKQLFEDISRDFSPRKGLCEKIGAGVYSISGKMPLEEFNRLFNVDMSAQDIKTVGGLLFHLFGRLPRRGEVLRSGGLIFKVTAVEEHRIAGVRVEQSGGEDEQ